jgi:hypothetical protein
LVVYRSHELIEVSMVNKILSLFKQRSASSTIEKHYKKSNQERCHLSFWGIKIDLTNPKGNSVFITILFLVAVILMILLLRDYIKRIHF